MGNHGVVCSVNNVLLDGSIDVVFANLTQICQTETSPF